MKCNVCGSDNVEGSIFCEDCGSKLSAPAPVIAAAPAAAPAPFAPAPVVEAPAVTPAPFTAAASATPVVETPVAAAPVATPAVAPVAAAPAAAPAVSDKICPACGAHNEAGSKFCEDCGATLGGASTPVATPSVSNESTAVKAAPAAAPRLIMPNGVEIPITAEHTLLGRQSPADNIYPEIDLTELDPESYVSRRHGQITRQGSKYLYEDVGSYNGSFINGNRLQFGIQTELHDCDTIRLGRTEMTFRA